MDFEKEIRVLYTCGMCETACENYFGHPCLMNFKEVYVDNNSYFYPMMNDKKSYLRHGILEDGTEGIIVQHRDVSADKDASGASATAEKKEMFASASLEKSKKGLGITKASTTSVKKRSFAGPAFENLRTKLDDTKIPGKTRSTAGPQFRNWRKKLSDTETRVLLMKVQQRIPLWNYTIPIEKRRWDIIESLWNEVSAALNGKLNPDQCKLKFRSLRDTHRKIIKAELGGVERYKPQWKFYHSCEFLRDYVISMRNKVPQMSDDNSQPGDDLIVDDHDYLADRRFKSASTAT